MKSDYFEWSEWKKIDVENSSFSHMVTFSNWFPFFSFIFFHSDCAKWSLLTRKHPNYRKTFHMIIYTCKKRHFWRNHDAPCQPGWHDASTHLNCHKISIFEQFYTCRKSTFSNNRHPIFGKISLKRHEKHVFLTFFWSKHLDFLNKNLYTLKDFLQDIWSYHKFCCFSKFLLCNVAYFVAILSILLQFYWYDAIHVVNLP